MKATVNHAAYESPMAEVLTFNPEGVLCESTVKSTHNGFTNGGELDF